MARPKIQDNEKRTEQVNIRLTVDEMSKVTEYSAASGMIPAKWIRIKIFTGKFPVIKLSPLDASMYQELKKIGVNLNQATHRLNQGDVPKDYILRQLEALALLRKIINALLNDRESNQG